MYTYIYYAYYNIDGSSRQLRHFVYYISRNGPPQTMVIYPSQGIFWDHFLFVFISYTFYYPSSFVPMLSDFIMSYLLSHLFISTISFITNIISSFTTILYFFSRPSTKQCVNTAACIRMYCMKDFGTFIFYLLFFLQICPLWFLK